MKALTLLLFLIASVLMFTAVEDLPSLGERDARASQHVSPRYIEKGYQETGARNLVTGVLIDYRGIDTLGETLVVLIAGIAVTFLLRIPLEGDSDS